MYFLPLPQKMLIFPVCCSRLFFPPKEGIKVSNTTKATIISPYSLIFPVYPRYPCLPEVSKNLTVQLNPFGS